MKDLPLIQFNPEPQRSERSDAAANRARILQTARDLFEQQGVAAVTMAEIAQAAGVGKGTLYRRFADKGALCLALLNDAMRDFQDRFLHAQREQTRSQVALLDQLAWFLEALIYFQHDYLPLLFEAQREGALSGEKTMPLQWQSATVRGLLEAAIDAGEVGTELDAALVADLLLAPLTASFYRFLKEQRGVSPERMSAGLRRLVRALKAYS